MTHLETLSLAIRRASTDAQHGQRQGTSRGGQIEFKDYRNYAFGDDPRYIDWNLFSRLGKLFVKEFAKDENVPVIILIDTSASMDYGDPSKRIYSLKLACCLAYLSLSSNDKVCLLGRNSEETTVLNYVTGKNSLFKVIEFLLQLDFKGKTNLTLGLKETGQKARGRGLVFVISDFYDESDFLKEVKVLRAKGQNLSMLHVLSPQENDPSGIGKARLVDAETGEGRPVWVGKDAVKQYHAEMTKFKEQLHEDTSKHAINYIPISTDMPLDELVLGAFRKSGLIK